MEKNQIRRYELDFSGCSSVGQLYEVIAREMELPAWFGNNRSAFWDALTGMIETPASIVFHRQTKNPELADYIEKLIAIARRAENEEALGITVTER